MVPAPTDWTELEWTEPEWTAPLDVRRYLEAVPKDAVVKGFFPAAVVASAKARGHELSGARPRYVPFKSYPMSEHVRLLPEAAALLFPGQPTRTALRRMGWHTLRALEGSLVGRVFRQFLATDVKQTLDALARMYEKFLPPATLELQHVDAGELVAGFRAVYAYVDSHHLGILERAFRAHGIEPRLDIRVRSVCDLDVRCRW